MIRGILSKIRYTDTVVMGLVEVIDGLPETLMQIDGRIVELSQKEGWVEELELARRLLQEMYSDLSDVKSKLLAVRWRLGEAEELISGYAEKREGGKDGKKEDSATEP